MSAPDPHYELVLMLDPEVPDERRDQIAADAKKRIESTGDLKSDSVWGMRKLAFEISQRTEADYRFFRFETGGSLLDDLNHNLKIADGVLRFRIFKVDPSSPTIVPPPPSPLASGAPPRRRGDGPRGRSRDEDRPAAPAEPAPAPPAQAEAAPAAPAEAEAPPAEASAAEAPAEPGAAEQPAGEAQPAPEAPAEGASADENA